MKIAILKGGTNVTFSANNGSAANADIQYLLRQLNISEHEVTIVTHKTRNTVIPKRLKFLEVQEVNDLNDFDRILVFNFSINFFGGAEDLNLMKLYQILHNTDKEFIYVNTDGNLPFKQIWDHIKKRDWASKYEDVNLIIDPHKIIYLTQGYREQKVINMIAKRKGTIPREIRYYDISRTILAHHELYFPSNKLVPFEHRPYELGFGGYVRNAHKRKKIEQYYRGENTLLFGNLRGVNTGFAKILPKVGYQSIHRMMNRCRNTIIIGDKEYEDNFFTLRMYEAVLADCITYIDDALDPLHRFYYGDHAPLYINSLREFGVVTYPYWKEIRAEVLGDYNYDQEKEKLVALIEG